MLAFRALCSDAERDGQTGCDGTENVGIDGKGIGFVVLGTILEPYFSGTYVKPTGVGE